MAKDNDKKIKELLSAIESKKKGLGTKPRAHLKTNGILKIGTDSGVNVNTLNSIGTCVFLVSKLLQERVLTKEACTFLGVPEQNSERATFINDALDDVKLRCQIIEWDSEKKKLQVMEKKLKDLRSEDAKTEEALSDIASSLK